jgi:hypothetical protein
VEGREVIFTEFLSTTPALAVAKAFSTPRKYTPYSVFFVLKIPKGTPSFNKHLGMQFGGDGDGEPEFLLPTCTKWIVESVVDVGGIFIVTMHLSALGRTYFGENASNDLIENLYYYICDYFQAKFFNALVKYKDVEL